MTRDCVYSIIITTHAIACVIKGEGELNTALKKARECSGLTQAEVAKKADISYRAYQDYEAEERIPNVYAAQSIAEVLNSTVCALWPLNQRRQKKRGD